jgi:arginase family enzyme
VSFISVPFSGGQPKAGAECGPDAIFAGQRRGMRHRTARR